MILIFLILDTLFSPLQVKDTSILYDTTLVQLTSFDLYKLLELKNSYKYVMAKNNLLKDEIKFKDEKIFSLNNIIYNNNKSISLLNSNIELKEKEIKINKRNDRIDKIKFGLIGAGAGLIAGLLIGLFSIK